MSQLWRFFWPVTDHTGLIYPPVTGQTNQLDRKENEREKVREKERKIVERHYIRYIRYIRYNVSVNVM